MRGTTSRYQSSASRTAISAGAMRGSVENNGAFYDVGVGLVDPCGPLPAAFSERRTARLGSNRQRRSGVGGLASEGCPRRGRSTSEGPGAL